MVYLTIEGRRDGYTPSQIDRTMTVGELIAYLENYGYNTPVILTNDNGYTFGSITEDSFQDDIFDDEDEDEEDEDEDE